tara:strand:+ start:73 stop:522 length:450 start_codon:yes stop_codon:yes gene_type:complete
MSDNLNKKDYQENNDTLITFGDEGLTMRKDDPKTKEFKEKNQKKLAKEFARGIADGEISLFAGLDISGKRLENEDYDVYKERQRTVKQLQKLYKQLGREECLKQFPMGFAYALTQAVDAEAKKKGLQRVEEKDMTELQKTQYDGRNKDE